MEYWFHDLPVELHMDGKTGAVRTLSGYVEIIPDTSISRDSNVNNWTLGHVMIRMGDHMVFADTWIETRVKHLLLAGDSHVDKIRLMWGKSQRDMRSAYHWEAACA